MEQTAQSKSESEASQVATSPVRHQNEKYCHCFVCGNLQIHYIFLNKIEIKKWK